MATPFCQKRNFIWKNSFVSNFIEICCLWCDSVLFTSSLVQWMAWHRQIMRTHTNNYLILHYNDVIMSAVASQITSISIIYSTVYSGADQRKHQSSASLAFVRRIQRWLVNSPHKGPVTRKMLPFDDVIMKTPYVNLLSFHKRKPCFSLFEYDEIFGIRSILLVARHRC